MLSRLVSLILGLSFALGNAVSARADGMATGIAVGGMAVGGIGAVAMGIALKDAYSSGGDCVCEASTETDCTPKSTTTDCMMMGVNMAAMSMMALQSASGLATASAAKSGGGGGDFNLPTYDLTQPIGPQVDPSIDCSNSTSGICSPDPLGEIDKSAAAFNLLLDKGALELPPNTTAADLKAKMAKDVKLAKDVLTGNISASDYADFGGGAGGGSMADRISALKGAHSSGSGGYGSDGGGGGVGMDLDFGTIGKKAGPADTAGLGKTLWNGMLDQIDEESGKSLTIFQRATRRYQGDKGRRSFYMAQIEFVRQQASRASRKPASVAMAPIDVKTKAKAPRTKSSPKRPALKVRN